MECLFLDGFVSRDFSEILEEIFQETISNYLSLIRGTESNYIFDKTRL